MDNRTVIKPGLNMRRNAGSVLVLVVVLLVLVFLMGAAYMVTTRTDRYSAEGFRTTSRDDLAIEAVEHALTAQIVADSPFYDAQLATPTNARMWDCATNDTNDQDRYLAERYPNWRPAGFGTAAGTLPAPHPYWSSISWPTQATAGVYQFVDPRTLATFPLTLQKDSYAFQPSFWTDTTGGHHPAMEVYATNFNTLLTATPFAAADADGDGVPDSMLFEVPQIAGDGLRYFAAIRVVDNCAAVNANTAWSRVWDFDDTGNAVPLDPTVVGNPRLVSGYFPTGVGLIEMLGNVAANEWNAAAPFTIDALTSGTDNLTSNTESRNLYNARAGLWLTDTATPDLWGVYRAGGQVHWPLRDPVSPSISPVESNTVNGYPEYVFQTMGDALSSQLARRLENPGYATDTIRFRNFPEADSLSLATGFCIASSATSPSTAIEQTLRLSVFQNAPTTPYQLTAAAFRQWYLDNFNWGDAGGTRPIRSIRSFLTLSNGVAERMATHTVNVASGIPDYPYTFAQPAAPPPGFPTDRNPAKASVNNADFPTLWRAFFNSMCNPAALGTPQAPPGLTTRVLNSPVRDAGITPTQLQVMYLRSAVAAVNAEDLRAGLFTVPTGHAIVIPADGASPAYDARVYGTKAQPYINEVLYDIDASGTEYLAIELYNPYGTAISLNGWMLATYNQAANTLTALHTFGATDTAPSGYLVLATSATAPTTPAPVNLFSAPTVIAGLTGAIEQELVLLRPSSLGGALPTDLAPVDQVDLRGIRPTTAGVADRFTYQRADGVGQSTWPGITRAPAYPSAAMMAMTENATAPGTLGTANGASETMTAGTAGIFTIPLAFRDWPGPYAWNAGPVNTYPFGAFARNGDMLRIPFIGSYSIAATGALATPSEVVSPTLDADRVENNTIPAAGTAIGRFVAAYGAWTGQLFHYLTVDLPADDYMPSLNVAGAQPLANGPIVNLANANRSTNDGDPNERSVPVHGKININTVPWRILSTLPMLPPISTPGTADYRDAQAALIGVAIETQRRTGAPFATIADLNTVAAFQNGNGLLPAAPDETWGEYSAFNVNFEHDNLMLSRISNMITTRSDSFTVYITVQAWRNAGTPNTATMETERRAAFLVDRSGVTPSRPNPRIVPIPMR